MLSYKSLSKENFENYFRDLANMRIKYFSEFPYLYAGSLEYEYPYLSGYLNHKDGRIIVVLEKNQVIGMATGFPLHQNMNNSTDITKWFRTTAKIHKKEATSCFYLGEVIIKSSMRQNGVAYHLTKFIENDFLNRGYKKSVLITVERDKEHPLAPSRYFPMEYTLKKMKYKEMGVKEAVIYDTNQIDGSIKSDTNTMIFWEKTL